MEGKGCRAADSCNCLHIHGSASQGTNCLFVHLPKPVCTFQEVLACTVGSPLCLIANAEMLSQHQIPIWVQVVLFNALSSEPEDDPCIRLTGVSGGLQVSCLSNYCCLPMHGCNVMQ